MSSIIKANSVVLENVTGVWIIRKKTNPDGTSTDVMQTSKEIVSDTDIEKEAILKKAYEESRIIIQQANDQKRNMMVEMQMAIEEKEKEGFEKGHQDGYKQGYDKGETEGKKLGEEYVKKQSEDLLSDLCNKIYAVDEIKDDILKKFEDNIMSLAVEIAEKIILTKVDYDEEIIKKIVKNSIKDYKNVEWIKLYLSGDDYVTISTDKEIINKLSQVSEHVKLEVLTEGKSGDLIVETPESLVDSGVKSQLDNVKSMILGG